MGMSGVALGLLAATMVSGFILIAIAIASAFFASFARRAESLTRLCNELKALEAELLPRTRFVREEHQRLISIIKAHMEASSIWTSQPIDEAYLRRLQLRDHVPLWRLQMRIHR